MNFKQFFNLLKQQRLFSGIYVTCTALSTALTMTLFLVIYIMVGPVYPEQERGRMAVVQTVRYDMAEDGMTHSISSVGLSLADSLRKMPEVERLTAITYPRTDIVSDASGKNLTCATKGADDVFWQVYDFRFLHGRPFTREEWEANSPVCVISEGLARRVFGRTDVADRMLSIGGTNIYDPDEVNKQLRIVGVVEDVSVAVSLTYAQIWIPYDEEDDYNCGIPFYGSYTLVMLLHEDKTVTQLQERVARWQRRINQEEEAAGLKIRLDMDGRLQPHWQSSFVRNSSDEWQPVLRTILGMLLAFLLIPAMNMSSMVASRINARISELGIRRAYGASRAALLWQVLEENFLLTLVGSLMGLAISWLIVTLGADWLVFIFNDSGRELAGVTGASVQVHADMLISGWVMAAVIAATLLLNLVSALVPALWTLRKPVTEEINSKR